MSAQLLDWQEQLSPADHQTHRRLLFPVPPNCRQLRIHVRYAPKYLSAEDSATLAHEALRNQAVELASRIGEQLAEDWAAAFATRALENPIHNLLTISLDDATGAYRGAGHRQAQDQLLFVGIDDASPGLVAGRLPAGEWTLTLSAHTLVSPRCEVSIQIGAETASSLP